jgi:hypothetical protein
VRLLERDDVAGIEQKVGDEPERLLRAVGDDHLLGRSEAAPARQVLGDRGAELRHAGGRRVVEIARRSSRRAAAPHERAHTACGKSRHDGRPQLKSHAEPGLVAVHPRPRATQAARPRASRTGARRGRDGARGRHARSRAARRDVGAGADAADA